MKNIKLLTIGIIGFLFLMAFNKPIISSNVPFEHTSKLESIKIKCTGNACSAVSVVWDENQQGYVFTNKNKSGSKSHQIGNTIQIFIKYLPGKSPSPFASCSQKKWHKLKYGEEWTANISSICEYSANYIDLTTNPDPNPNFKF